MSGSDLAAAFELVARHPEMAWFAGPRPPALIEAAEGALGCGLPADHREFLLRLGAGSFGAFAIVTGEPLDDDIRAELDLLRAELEMLKRAFRRHCLETM
jgi:hypothetical protein